MGHNLAQRTHCFKGHEFTTETTYITPEGRRSCRICRTKRTTESQKRNHDAILERKRARRALGDRPPSETREGRRIKNLQQIGWTPELFESRLEEQDNKCAVCGKVLNLDLKQNGSRACADHEHCDPPKPRGVLCTNCNLGIGNLQDNPDIMKAAIAYIEKWR